MKNSQTLQVLAKLTEDSNSKFYDDVQSLRSDIGLPSFFFEDEEEFFQWNIDWSAEEIQRLRGANTAFEFRVGVAEVEKAKVTGKDLEKVAGSLIEEYGLNPTEFTTLSLISVLLFGDLRLGEDKVELGSELVFETDNEAPKLYFKIHKETRRDTLVKNWDKNRRAITHFQNYLPDSDEEADLVLDENEQTVKLFLKRKTVKTHVKRMWNEISALQEKLIGSGKRACCSHVALIEAFIRATSESKYVDNVEFTEVRESRSEIISKIERYSGEKVSLSKYKKLQQKVKKLQNGE